MNINNNNSNSNSNSNKQQATPATQATARQPAQKELASYLFFIFLRMIQIIAYNIIIACTYSFPTKNPIYMLESLLKSIFIGTQTNTKIPTDRNRQEREGGNLYVIRYGTRYVVIVGIENPTQLPRPLTFDLSLIDTKCGISTAAPPLVITLASSAIRIVIRIVIRTVVIRKVIRTTHSFQAPLLLLIEPRTLAVHCH